METLKARKSWTDVLQTLRYQGCQTLRDQGPDLNSTYLQIQHDRKYYKENCDQRNSVIPMKTQAINNLTTINPKKGNTHTTITTTKTKKSGIINHWAIASLNINRLNSSIKRHRL